MKRINILLIAIVLLALTLPVMGQTTFSGEVKGGFYQPIQDASAASAINAAAKLSASFKSDDNVSGTLALVAQSGTALLDAANASINLLPAFGVTDVPLAMTLTVGKTDTGASGVADFTNYGFEKFDTGVGTASGFDNMKLDTKIMDLVTVRTGIAPASYSGNLAQFTIGAFGTVGPVAAELFYGNAKRPNGDIAIGARFDQAVGDLALKVGGTFQAPLAENTDMEWGAGLSAAYTTLAKLTASAEGKIKQGTSTGDALRVIGIGLTSTPIPLITLEAGLTLDTTENADNILDGIELATQFNLGKYTLSVGYNYTGKAAGATVIKNDAFVGSNAIPGSSGGIGVKSSVTF